MEDNLTSIVIVIVVIGIPFLSLFGVGAFKAWLRHQERKYEIWGGNAPANQKNNGVFGKVYSGDGSNDNSKIDDSVVKELRDEIHKVRQVAKEYDLSIQHTLDEIQRRLDFLESQRVINPTYVTAPKAASPQEQILTSGPNSTQ